MSNFHCLSLALLLVLTGCGAPKSAILPKPPKEVTTKKANRVSNRPANLNGSVFIVEYHKIAKEEARWDRSISRFKSDLQRCYDLGFRPVTLSEYIENEMPLPPSASPIVFTFDDSHLSQFKIKPNGEIDPDCAIGIWKNFTETHPDFPIRASFYVLPPTPWGQKDTLKSKLKMLKDWGCELGSHSLTHGKLAGMSEEQVKAELGGAIDFVSNLGFDAKSIALPYGISPKDPSLLSGFQWKGKRYSHKAALLVGAHPAPSPTSGKLNLMRLPRIQAIEGDYGISYWLDRMRSNKVNVYVSP